MLHALAIVGYVILGIAVTVAALILAGGLAFALYLAWAQAHGQNPFQ